MNWRWQLAQAAEIRWWRHYLRTKEPADYLRQKEAYWQRILARLEVSVPAGSKVLDAGCGPAGVFLHLAQAQVTALDPLLDHYDELSHFTPAQYPWVTFKRGLLEDLDGLGDYDLVFCMNVINHVADLELSLQKLWENCRPKGRLVITVDAHNYSLFRYLFGWIPGDILHPHQYFLEEYLEKIRRAGYRIERSVLLKKNFFFNYYGIVAVRG